MNRPSSRIASLLFIVLLTSPLFAQKKPFIPRRQDKPPGPPLSPAEAIKKMRVPPGFSVELVASEPQIVNPVAMCFDEKGRIWVTESLEYPRRRPGKGRDRVKVLEDTDGDGKVDKTTVVIEGLNIPSGINVGYGGVWVANSPDLLFYPFKDRDKPTLGKPQVVVTGFGRTDTHELPNSLTWGPDGWLYGLNGVFNYSHVRYAKSNPNYNAKHPGWKFTCAMFRIHPRTRKFEVFAEGTSNPWGIAFNNDGEAFISACVIDHLWHITETGYYHRQGGPYPPHTWKIGSIVKHKHQKAAYCGIHYYDSDAYPKEYRGHLYMGNVHGGCINVDTLQRDGSTYFAKPRPDFLTANDVWFMPVAQKTGPDGCLYILDWYDRYHCYQDANADPKGIDRLHGRLYRVRYTGPKSPFAPRKDAGRTKPFDLSKETNPQLLQRLSSGNGYIRDIARRILTERYGLMRPLGVRKRDFDAWNQLMGFVGNPKHSQRTRMNALWVAIGSNRYLPASFHNGLLKHPDAGVRAWAVRAAGNHSQVAESTRKLVVAMASDPSPRVRLQVAIAARKLNEVDAVSVLSTTLAKSGTDSLLPRIVWNNCRPLLAKEAKRFLKVVERIDLKANPAAATMAPYLAGWMLDHGGFEELLLWTGIAASSRDPSTRSMSAKTLAMITAKVQNGEIPKTAIAKLKRDRKWMGRYKQDVDDRNEYVFEMAMFWASIKDRHAVEFATKLLSDRESPVNNRLAALRALVSINDSAAITTTGSILSDPKSNSPDFRGKLLAELARLKDDKVGDVVLKHYAKLEPELQPKAIELLTQRANWSRKLLAAIGTKQVPAEAINLNQARRLMGFKDKGLQELVRKHWGVVRTERDPQRARYVAKWKAFLRKTPGDPFKGHAVFKKVCAQCHKMYGEGVEVGPDITRNGRNSYDQLLSNVFDPSLVIGASYRAYTVATKEGRIITGLLVENSKQRIVLKVQGGKQETIARSDIEFEKESNVSMMPEQLEKQLKPQEIADLFAFLVLDKHPKDPNAKQLPGTRVERSRRRKRRL